MRPDGRKGELRWAERRLIFLMACACSTAFTRWRKSHTGRLPIPDPLWAAAAEMAREHGVFRTAKVLSLEYGKLKRLMAESQTGPRRTARLR